VGDKSKLTRTKKVVYAVNPAQRTDTITHFSGDHSGYLNPVANGIQCKYQLSLQSLGEED
jgi:hypothetical protein